jgi:hypothetical protein
MHRDAAGTPRCQQLAPMPLRCVYVYFTLRTLSSPSSLFALPSPLQQGRRADASPAGRRRSRQEARRQRTALSRRRA